MSRRILSLTVAIAVLAVAHVGARVFSSSQGPAITFAATIELPLPPINAIGDDGYGLVVADVNNDGSPDVLVSDLNHTRVLVYAGNGLGSFSLQPGVNATEGTPANMAAGDFNRDGNVDLVVANYISNAISVMLGNGDATFGPRSNYYASAPQGAIVADFDNDGWPDFAVSSSFDGLEVFINGQDGSFLPRPPIATTTIGDHNQLVAADFNHDGLVDLADHGVVALGTGGGFFGAAVNYGTSCATQGSNVAAGDLNEDGNLDLVIGARGNCHSVTILLGNGSGAFSPLPFGSPGRPNGDFEVGVRVMDLAIADFNGDGHKDVALVGSTESFFRVLAGHGDGTFDVSATVPIAGAYGKHVAVADFDGDTRLDIVVTQAANPAVFLNTTPVDTAAPDVTCAAVDILWHGDNVVIACSATDVGSGLGNTADASFSLSTSVPAGMETSAATTSARTICDIFANCTTIGPLSGIRIDRRAPTVLIGAPANAAYTLNQPVLASFSCGDGGSGVASCDGTVPNGSSIDTATLGVKSFAVTTTDLVGNNASSSVNYTVSLGGVFSSVSPARIWLGLKNSDDVGTNFDLLAEVLKNGVVVGSGQLNGIPGGSSGFNNAVQRAIGTALAIPTSIGSGDTLAIRLSVRIATGVGGHRSGTARLWFGDAAANSRVDAVVNGVSRVFYLQNGGALGAAPGAGPRSTSDVLVDRAAGGNPFKPFGTWAIVF